MSAPIPTAQPTPFKLAADLPPFPAQSGVGLHQLVVFFWSPFVLFQGGIESFPIPFRTGIICPPWDLTRDQRPLRPMSGVECQQPFILIRSPGRLLDRRRKRVQPTLQRDDL